MNRRDQLTKVLIRIEQQLNEAETLAVQPGDDVSMMEWTAATINKVRTSIRRLEKRLRHEPVDANRFGAVPPARAMNSASVNPNRTLLPWR